MTERTPLNSMHADSGSCFEGIVVRDSSFPACFSCFYPVRGITLWPFIFLAKDCDNEVIINHEKIHIAQANETAVIGMYIVWVFDFLR